MALFGPADEPVVVEGVETPLSLALGEVLFSPCVTAAIVVVLAVVQGKETQLTTELGAAVILGGILRPEGLVAAEGPALADTGGLDAAVKPAALAGEIPPAALLEEAALFPAAPAPPLATLAPATAAALAVARVLTLPVVGELVRPVLVWVPGVMSLTLPWLRSPEIRLVRAAFPAASGGPSRNGGFESSLRSYDRREDSKPPWRDGLPEGEEAVLCGVVVVVVVAGVEDTRKWEADALG